MKIHIKTHYIQLLKNGKYRAFKHSIWNIGDFNDIESAKIAFGLSLK